MRAADVGDQQEEGCVCPPITTGTVRALPWALLILMATGKGAPLSLVVGSRWRLAKPGRAKPLPRRAREEQRPSAFTELRRPKERLGGSQAVEREHGGPAGRPDPQQLPQDVRRDPAGSTVFSVWSGGGGGGERSAFSKPAKRLAERPGLSPTFQASESAEALRGLSGLISSADLPCWGRLSNCKLSAADFWNVRMLPQNALPCAAFRGAPTLWLECAEAQLSSPLSSPTTSWALLPPTLSSLGLPTQNWCAKCSLSFRLTSDLVFHMRSHHKKEQVGPDPRSKKMREEALSCPVCHEYFRERHHLSRHMSSHS
ncbi:zinc finger protein 488 [Tupaia chinensis]|uniref:zinc finger protein 488 n=1 Tax=Tupaia chinensis TaxID=246437 RepID=UPI0003C8FE90|nr:zinc finger protein 488 [Tupaia chinensis]